MSDRMNIAAKLEDEFPQLMDGKITNSMKSRKPSDSVALLRATMKNGGLGGTPIRHVPIIDSQINDPNIGELQALISHLDLDALLTPPWDEIPQSVIDKKKLPISSLAQEIARVVRQTIKEAFAEFFVKTPELSTTDELGMAIDLLSKQQKFGNKTRRYRTIPVFNQQNKLVGMLSYYNVLEEMSKRIDHKIFLDKKVSELLREIGQKKEGLFKLERERPLLEASAILDGAPFTHIPLIEGGDNSWIVTGIIDDVKVKTFEHNLLIEAFSEMPLSAIETPVSKENTVTMEDTIEDAIKKFLKKPERPTALLVGTEKSGKFYMDGIISYVDILRNFKKFLGGGDNAQNRDEE